MKATIDFDDALYRRLKIEAARRNRSIRDLIAEGVRRVLDAPTSLHTDPSGASSKWNPSWLGSLGKYGASVKQHDMGSIRRSIARGRGPGR